MNLGVFKNQAFASLFWSGVFFLIIGVLGLINPTFMALYLVYMIALFFCFAGASSLYMGFKFSKQEGFAHGLYIFMGIIQILLAFSLLVFPLQSELMIFIYIAVFLLIKGIFIIINIIFHRKSHPMLASTSLSTGIIDILFGLCLLIMPFVSNVFLLLVLAWYFLFTGVGCIASAYSLKKDIKKEQA